MEHSEHFVATAAPPVVAIGTGIIVPQVIPCEIVMPSSCLAVRGRSEAASSRLRTASHTTFYAQEVRCCHRPWRYFGGGRLQCSVVDQVW